MEEANAAEAPSSTSEEALAAAAADFSGSEEQHAAATKVQAIHRGNAEREAVRFIGPTGCLFPALYYGITGFIYELVFSCRCRI